MYLNATRLAIKNGEHTWGRGKHGFIHVITRYDQCIHSHVDALLQMSSRICLTTAIGRMHTLRKHVLLGHIEHSTRYWSSPGVCACMHVYSSIALHDCFVLQSLVLRHTCTCVYEHRWEQREWGIDIPIATLQAASHPLYQVHTDILTY